MKNERKFEEGDEKRENSKKGRALKQTFLARPLLQAFKSPASSCLQLEEAANP